MADSAILAPAAPFSDGGEGGYRRLPDLNRDIDLAKRALGNERWPITAQRRADVVEWLMLILDNCEDARTQVNAAKALLAADKLNIEEAKLRVQIERQEKPQEVHHTHSGAVGVYDFSKLSIEEVRSLADLHAKARGEPIPDSASSLGSPVVTKWDATE